MDPYLTELSRRLRSSDGSALTELFRTFHEPLLRYAFRLVRDGDVSYDVVQESFIRLWEHRERLDPERSLKAYLYQIVRNTALNHHQAQVKADRWSVQEEAGAEQFANDTEEAVAVGELGACIRRWIDEMPPKRQEAFRLSREQGLSHAEIAAVMGLAPRTVTSHVMLALQFLKERLRVYEKE